MLILSAAVPPDGHNIVGLCASTIVDDGYCPLIEVGILCARDGQVVNSASERAVRKLDDRGGQQKRPKGFSKILKTTRATLRNL